MKALIGKFLPGIALIAVACIAFNLGTAKAQQAPSSPPPAADRPAIAATAADPAANPQTIICGSCGAELGRPRVLMIADPVRGGRQGCEISAAPAYYAVPPVGAEPIVYAPAYFGMTASRCEPAPLFGEYRVNPIPYPAPRAYYR